MPLTAHYGHSLFDFTNYDNEASFGSGTAGNYFFKQEADSEKFITLRRIRLYFRDLGPAVINLTITGQNQYSSANQANDVVRNSVTISNFGFGGIPPFTVSGDGRIYWVYTTDFEITITTPQLSIARVSGAISIVKVVLVGDGEELNAV